MSTSHYELIVQEPSMTKNSSSSRAPKKGAQPQTTWRSAKNGLKRPKNRFIAAITTTSERRVVFSVAQLDCPRTPAMN